MLDLENAKKIFLEYVNTYDKESKMIDKKISHTLRVMEISKILATKLNLSKEDVDLATLIGLLHDIGRFEQAKQTDSYSDCKGTDHAEIGVKVLFDNNMIRDFLPNDIKYDTVIKLAVREHNKLEISEGISEKEELFCKLIRDADKLENLETFMTANIEERGRYNSLDIKTDEISNEVLEDFYNNKLISIDHIKTALDLSMKVLAFIFDLNYDVSFKIINEKKYINKIIDNIEEFKPSRKDELEAVRKFSNKYIAEKIGRDNKEMLK